MRDNLLDVVEHTFDLGCIELIKITGTDTETVQATSSIEAEEASIHKRWFFWGAPSH